MRRGDLVLIALLALAGCREELREQPRYDAFEAGRLFRNDMVLQEPPVGTIPQEHPAQTAGYRERPPLDLELLARGRERYGIFCSPCHGDAGYGDGPVPARGYPRPPSYHSERLRRASSTHFFNVITRGYGVMYSYAARVPPADRWAIAAYIRALQISQRLPTRDLPPEARKEIEEALEREDGDAG